MKIQEYHQPEIDEDRIDFYYRRKNKDVQELLAVLRKHSSRLSGKSEDRDVMFSLKDVYYFESVDKRTFAYLDHEVLRIEFRLQDIEEAYGSIGFVRVNKSTIVNIYKIESLKSEINMRIIAILENGEKIQINRSYKANFNKMLNSLRER